MPYIRFSSNDLSKFTAAITQADYTPVRNLQLTGFNPDTGEFDDFSHRFDSADAQGGFVYIVVEPISGYKITGVTDNYGYDPTIGKTIEFQKDGKYWVQIWANPSDVNYANPPNPIEAYVTVAVDSEDPEDPEEPEDPPYIVGTTAIFSPLDENANFKVEVVKSDGEELAYEIPLNEEFEFYKEPGANWYVVISPINDSEILDISVTPPPQYNPDTGEFEGLTFQAISGGRYRSTLNDAMILMELDFTVEVHVAGGSSVVSPFNQLFIMNAELLAEFGEVPMHWEPYGSAGPVINLTDYILNLVAIPFKLPEEYIDAETKITLGEFETQVEAPRCNSDSIVIDLGEIEVSEFMGNSIDYLETKIELVLPFVPVISDLDPNLVIGKKINVKYVLDAYTGDLTVNVYNGGAEPIESTKTAVGRLIPFKMLTNVAGSIGGVQGAENGVFTAYARVTRPELTDGEFDNLVTVNGELGESSGYVVVEEINLQVKATLAEQQQIISLLSSGVIIK